jgi:serine/threonine-protein kinase
MNVGDRLGKYRLTRPLGGGAMGFVWAAVNEDTHKEVALKLLRSPNEELRHRLLREAKACGRLDHRNIVVIYDIGTTPEGEPFLVMQLLSGETLASRIKRVGRLPPEVAAAIGAAIAAGLAAAHAEGIVHRDLKPDNVFLHREPGTAGEVVKIVDFGVSRVEIAGDVGGTATGMLIGSPAYMSPEQARGSKLDPRSDIWSLGVVLFEMLTGARPFQGPSIADAMVQILTAPIPEIAAVVPGAPPGLSAIVSWCLTRELERRPAHAAQIGAQLLSFTMSSSGQYERVESPSRRGAPPEESTQLLVASPRAAVRDTVHLAGSAVDDDGRKTVPVPPLRGGPLTGTIAVAPPSVGAVLSSPLSTSPPFAAPVGHTSGATASSSTTPLMRADAPQSLPRGAPRSTVVIALAALAMLATAVLLVGVFVIKARHVPEASTAPAMPGLAPAPAPVPAPGLSGEASAASAVASAPVPGESAAEAPPAAPEPDVESSARAAPAAASGQGKGLLTINSIPMSNIVLDGKPIGSTPKVGLAVSAGLHTVTFAYPTGERHRKGTSVLPGTSEVLTDRLEKAPGVPAPGF